MPMYEFRCPECGAVESVYAPILEGPPELVLCPAEHLPRVMRRDYSSVQIAPVQQAHFDRTIGKEISSHRAFRDELNRKQDEMSERLGFEQRYAIADGSDRDALGVSPDFQPSARRAE